MVKKILIIILIIQTGAILVFIGYAMIQQTEAKKQEKLAVANAERAIQMQKMAESQQMIAMELSRQLKNCQTSSK